MTQSSRKPLGEQATLELIAHLLEGGELFDRGGDLFADHSKLFIGSSKNPDLGPTLGVYFDAAEERLAALTFGMQAKDLLMIPFNFDLDPPLSKAGKEARTHMLVLSAELRSGQRFPEFRAALAEFIKPTKLTLSA